MVHRSNTFNFNVIESGDPGYVQVHSNKRNLTRDGRMIFPVGQNFPSPDEPCLAYRGACYNSINETMVYDTIWSVDSNGDSSFVLDEFYYGHNLYSTNQKSEKVTNIVAWNNYLEMLEQYFQTPDGGGSKYFRTVQMPHSSLLEFEEKGNYYDRLHYAAETDKILELCEEYDALFMFNLMYQNPIMKYANYNQDMWDWDYYMEGDTLPLPSQYWLWEDPVYCYNDDPSYVKPDNTIHVGTKKPYEMFLDEEDLNYHKQRTRYYIARYGYSTKIYAFEILSEPWHLSESWESEQDNQDVGAPFLDINNPDHQLVRNAVYNYHKVISEYIKDSLSYNRHLIGMNMANELGGSSGGIDLSITLSSIDFVGFNPYYSVPHALIKSMSSANTMYHYTQKIRDVRDIIGLGYMPILISEGGTDESYMSCSNFDMDIVDKMTLPFTGVAGINTWLGYRYNFYDFEHENDVVTMPSSSYDMWDNTIRVKNHMNGDDVINTLSDGWGSWNHGMEKSKLNSNDNVEAVEMQAYVSSNKKLIVGYVRNRTYNLYTKGQSGTSCENVFYDENRLVSELSPVNQPHLFEWNAIQNNKRIKVKELLNVKKYNVDFYNQHQWIADDSKFTSLSGSLKIRFPFFNLSHPVIWFVAKSEDYNGMMQNNDITEDSLGTISKMFLANERDTIIQEASLRVYPNPFKDYFIVESPVNDKIVIREPSGKIVLQEIISKEGNRVRIEELSSGIYFVHFVKQNKTIKIVKR